MLRVSGKARSRVWMKCTTWTLLYFLSAPVFGDSWKQVDVEERISGFLSGDNDSKWVESGELDLDGDGDLDLLLKVNYNEEPDRKRAWEVYINQDEKYHFSRGEGMLPVGRENLEFRRVKLANEGKRVLIKYRSRSGGGRSIMAFWYEKSGNQKYERRIQPFTEKMLMNPKKDETVSSSEGDAWSSRGFDIKEVLKNYKRHSSLDE